MPGFHAGLPPRNKGRRYPAGPPTVEEIVAVMRAAGDGRHGCRLRGLIVVLCRAGLRIREALALNESDLARGRAAHRYPAPARPQHLGITSIYLQGIDNAEIIEVVHARRAPLVRVSASLRL